MKLKIILDLPSLKSSDSKKILNYDNNKIIEFYSFQESKKYTHLDFKEDVNDTYKNQHKIYFEEIDKHTNKVIKWASYWFGYRIQDIKSISDFLDIKYDDLFLVFVLEVLTQHEKSSFEKAQTKTILITERKKILNKTNQAKSQFPKLLKNTILSPQEGRLYIDLFLKNHGEYSISHLEYVNKGLWYYTSMQSKLVHFTLPWSILTHMYARDKSLEDYFNSVAALGDRFTDLLMAIDQIGQAYYKESTNDAMEDTLYHFNYWVSLYTGVIDSLAWISKYRYGIEVVTEVDIRLISDNKNNSFLPKLASCNPPLKKYINANQKIISFLGGARDIIIHRDRLKGVRVAYKDKKMDYNTIKMPLNFEQNLNKFTKLEKQKILSGDHKSINGMLLIEPYSFVRNVTPFLVNFTNDFIKLLEFEEYLKNDSYLNQVLKESKKSLYDIETLTKRFQAYSLGY